MTWGKPPRYTSTLTLKQKTAAFSAQRPPGSKAELPKKPVRKVLKLRDWPDCLQETDGGVLITIEKIGGTDGKK